MMDKDMLDKAVIRAAEGIYITNSNHMRPNGLDGLSIGYNGENTCGADGEEFGEEAYTMWYSHDAHRDNMLSTAWKSTGLVIIEINDCYGTYSMAIQAFSNKASSNQVIKPSYKYKTETRTIQKKKYIWSY